MQASPAMPNNSVAPAPSEAGAMDGKPKKKGFVRRMLNNRNGWVKRFARQDLPGWSPIITAKMVVLFYLLSALILLPLGGAILAASLGVKEYSVRPQLMFLVHHRVPDAGPFHATGYRKGPDCGLNKQRPPGSSAERRSGMTIRATSRARQHSPRRRSTD